MCDGELCEGWYMCYTTAYFYIYSICVLKSHAYIIIGVLHSCIYVCACANTGELYVYCRTVHVILHMLESRVPVTGFLG